MDTEHQKTVFAIHTGFAVVEMLNRQFKEQLPGVRIVNIVDDSLLPDVRAAGHLTPSVIRRIVGYAELAQSAGADAIFNCCSSVGEAADLARRVVDIPVVKIDEKMAEEAVARGKTVAIVATVGTTLDPTARLIEKKAHDHGKLIEITRHLVEGAFDALIAGDAEKHDQMVTSEIERAAKSADVVVLAQASMSGLLGRLEGKLPVPVLSSPQTGLQELKRVLQERTDRGVSRSAEERGITVDS